MKTKYLAVLALAAVSCRSMLNSPVDDALNWADAEAAFTTAVSAVTVALSTGKIDSKAGWRIEPFVAEGSAILERAFAAIEATPANKDPVIDVKLTRTLLSLATRITAMLAVEQASKAGKVQ
jgi:hypothetical protein